MPLSLIAAVSRNGCIGKDGGIPWNIPGEQLLFKELTLHKTVLMGRKTWESIPEQFRPLRDRLNVVITRQADYPLPPEVERFSDLSSALSAHASEDIYIIGGAEIYRATIDLADTLYLSHIDQIVEGDTFFPTIDPAQWQRVVQKAYPGFLLATYQRTNK